MSRCTHTQVSALKEREEGKICDKLKTDLSAFGETKEVEIPVIKPKRVRACMCDVCMYVCAYMCRYVGMYTWI
jgi:hypothetical protein